MDRKMYMEFLSLVRDYVDGGKKSGEDKLIKKEMSGDTKAPYSSDFLRGLLELAEMHKLTPLVYDSLSKREEFKTADDPSKVFWRAISVRKMMDQTEESAEFIKLYESLSGKMDVDNLPVVVKGIVCRQLYANPDIRPSSDEDLVVRSGSFEEIKEVLGQLEYEPARELGEGDNEVTFVGKRLHIDIHERLFGEDKSVFSALNEVFGDIFEKSFFMDIQGIKVRVPDYTKHFLFLIFHAFKHFVGPGVGLRQVLDMVMMTNAHGDEIDWEYLLDTTKKLELDTFFINLMDIGREYLALDENKCRLDFSGADSGEMLMDILDAGLYGKSSMDRLHSANITLTAIRKGKAKTNLLTSLFPKYSYMAERYEFVKKCPILLPAAYVKRIIGYVKSKDSNAADTIKVGTERLELLKKYKVI